MKYEYLLIGGILYVIGISIIGVVDSLNDGVRKREKAQVERSERLDRNQAILQENVARRQQQLAEDMRRRQV